MIPIPAEYKDLFAKYGQYYGIDPALLAAICSRESGFGIYLTPPGPAGTGDDGHGRGLMQIDDRTWTTFCASDQWKDPEENIRMGAQIMHANLTSSGWVQPVAVCAYNAGPARAYAIYVKSPTDSLIVSLDQITTGKDYVSDVLRRREQYAVAYPSSPQVC